MKKKILIVDDELDMVNMLRNFFRLKDFDTIEAYSGEGILDKLEENPDIILLDINMPGIDGFGVCKEIRNKTTSPILFLTARGSETDRVKGLMIGGDDYIVKPFSLNELYARVYSHLQREERKGTAADNKSSQLIIDYSSRTVHYKEKEIIFTKTEFDIIELLSSHPKMVFDREKIYSSLWGYEAMGDNSVVAEHIRKIRAKISEVTDKEYIQTVWGVGYKWVG